MGLADVGRTWFRAVTSLRIPGYLACDFLPSVLYHRGHATVLASAVCWHKSTAPCHSAVLLFDHRSKASAARGFTAASPSAFGNHQADVKLFCSAAKQSFARAWQVWAGLTAGLYLAESLKGVALLSTAHAAKQRLRQCDAQAAGTCPSKSCFVITGFPPAWMFDLSLHLFFAFIFLRFCS